MISETKIDYSFPLGDFRIGGFSKAYWLHNDSLGKGILLYVREDITSNLLEVEAKPIEGFYVEINMHNDKWLINCSYNRPKNMIGNSKELLLHELSKVVSVNNDDGLQRFCNININILNRHAPRNRKLALVNQMPFITKGLSKAIMKRSRLRTNFLKNRMGEIKPCTQNKGTTASHC